jgi:hypothetical protein
MALIPLNTFKTKTKLIPAYSATTASIIAYTAPIGVTSIVLMAQVSNITTQTQYVSVEHYRNRKVLKDAQGFGEQAGNTKSILAKEFAVPANDAASMLAGKLIIEELDSILAYATNSGTCQLVLSILETATD